MRLRDGPESMPLVAPVSHSELMPKRSTATGGRRTPKPKGKATKKPYQPSGYEWVRAGAGFDLRKVVWVESATGGKQRKRPYLGHLSRSAFGELKRRHKGAALERAIAEWIRDRDR